MEIDLQQLPIPDWGLQCPECRYALCGLPTHRCPECGTDIDVPSLVRPWTRLRPPRFTGDELPLPDFGLSCAHCDQDLAGAEGFRCPACREPFDLESLRPPGQWFVLDKDLARELPVSGIQTLLAAELVPHFEAAEDGLRRLYGVQSFTPTRLNVASEFYLDVLWLLEAARKEDEQRRAGILRPWDCPACGEHNPANFDVCWNCASNRSDD